TTPIKTNVRIICATHRDLRHLINQGLFREDLFYRLNVVPLRLPPLRERTEDIPDLVRHFLIGAAKAGLPRKEISPEAVNRLMTHRWPGNVRELENLVKRLLAMEVEEVIPLSAVERELATVPLPQAANGSVSASAAGMSLPEFMETHLASYFVEFGQGLPPEGLYERILADIEPALLRAALAATHGNQLRAADLLGINRNTLRSKLRERKVIPIRGVMAN
ncbi:MAG: sigma 54-interacting transcriptional regulator, partial [Phyllobacteriaceae bacterium]|nr:sigma 54-interacting transcriptional regulator [Phyllobacteriaceae bacterium]